MATKIKLMRLGKTHAPYYRIVVADARTRRGGRAIETIGKYHPMQDPSFIQVDPERAEYWLRVGAQPTEAVAAILKVTGDWQKFKGLPAPEPMRVAAPGPDRQAVFEAASKQAAGADQPAATTPRKRTAKASAGDVAKPAAGDGPTTKATDAAPPTDDASATPPAPETSPAEAPPTGPAEAPPAETPVAQAPAEPADDGQ